MIYHMNKSTQDSLSCFSDRNTCIDPILWLSYDIHCTYHCREVNTLVATLYMPATSDIMSDKLASTKKNTALVWLHGHPVLSLSCHAIALGNILRSYPGSTMHKCTVLPSTCYHIYEEHSISRIYSHTTLVHVIVSCTQHSCMWLYPAHRSSHLSGGKKSDLTTSYIN